MQWYLRFYYCSPHPHHFRGGWWVTWPSVSSQLVRPCMSLSGSVSISCQQRHGCRWTQKTNYANKSAPGHKYSVTRHSSSEDRSSFFLQAPLLELSAPKWAEIFVQTSFPYIHLSYPFTIDDMSVSFFIYSVILEEGTF